jgi:hypothetical protein
MCIQGKCLRVNGPRENGHTNVSHLLKYHGVLQITLLEKLDLINPCSYCLWGKAKLKIPQKELILYFDIVDDTLLRRIACVLINFFESSAFHNTTRQNGMFFSLLNQICLIDFDPLIPNLISDFL